MEQKFGERYSLNNKTLEDRYRKTISFVSNHIQPPSTILDLGIPNLLGEMLNEDGFKVSNTDKGVDLDEYYLSIDSSMFDVVTAFEIFEHLVAPYNILKHLKSPKLIASVPLNLWFTKAYWNENDPWDRHYHEFEPRQFDMLLEKAGWNIIDSEKWTSRNYSFGIRPFLRRFYPRYYIVYCEKP